MINDWSHEQPEHAGLLDVNDTVEVTSVNSAVAQCLVLFEWNEVLGRITLGRHMCLRVYVCVEVCKVDIYPSSHKTPLFVSSWIPQISADTLCSTECRQHVFV